MDVNVKDADRARYMVALVLIKQPMDIDLCIQSGSGNRYLNISPEDAIKQYQILKAEQGAAANP